MIQSIYLPWVLQFIKECKVVMMMQYGLCRCVIN
ncbi:hypothetical protein MUK42_24186 [Musa troglodytarum]|uniref:Uncharacterized protein n=1 Tax=Musa troglodytarum TaxID=320322 RepID=A0A9E7E8K0_9LILI|nr:hypothetical protein MUK42_24186 [Musa troglodytarum]